MANSDDTTSREARVLETARSEGASLAGIASCEALLRSPSHRAHGGIEPPPGARSVLVLALAHPEDAPELDWWGVEAGTRGNRLLRDMARRIKRRLARELGIRPHSLPYQPGGRGIYLKDAAVLAGMGVIGANNLLVTPQFGPRVRLRALFLEAELMPTGAPDGAADFAPCAACDRPCRRACPQDAFASGAYALSRCAGQMLLDEARGFDTVEYCRACELACPVGVG
jgi:epoxyqueuosine reductase